MISIKLLGISSNIFKIQRWRNLFLKQATGIHSPKSILWETLPNFLISSMRERDRIREFEKTENVMENIKLTRYLMILRSYYLIILGLVMVLYLSS